MCCAIYQLWTLGMAGDTVILVPLSLRDGKKKEILASDAAR